MLVKGGCKKSPVFFHECVSAFLTNALVSKKFTTCVAILGWYQTPVGCFVQIYINLRMFLCLQSKNAVTESNSSDCSRWGSVEKLYNIIL